MSEKIETWAPDSQGMRFNITDRYSATGTPYPNPKTMCKGQCEGMGVVPIHRADAEEPWHALWLEAHAKKCSFRGIARELWRHREWWYWRSVLRGCWQVKAWRLCDDDYHFVVCPDCNGTRLAA